MRMDGCCLFLLYGLGFSPPLDTLFPTPFSYSTLHFGAWGMSVPFLGVCLGDLVLTTMEKKMEGGEEREWKSGESGHVWFGHRGDVQVSEVVLSAGAHDVSRGPLVGDHGGLGDVLQGRNRRHNHAESKSNNNLHVDEI